MIQRFLLIELQALLAEYPIVTLIGPRQAGKTTLVRDILQGYAYSNLEQPEQREFARRDPQAYLQQFPGPVVFDEIQRVPELLSYLQVLVDEEKRNGRFILTGSHQLRLQEAVSQSLAGRTAVLNLLPLSLAELATAGIHQDDFAWYCHQGFLPRIYDQNMRPTPAYSHYNRTYVERDVRQLIHIKDQQLFEKFMHLLAGRAGQLVDYTALSNAVGVDAKTIKSWISILEASFLVFRLQPYYENFGKRVVKSPKIYFTDIGLLCFLLGIETPDQVRRDPLVGNIFENLVVLECLKSRLHRGQVSNLYFFRDNNGNEVDVLWKRGRELVAIEIKSATTFRMNHLKALRKFRETSGLVEKSYLVYNGSEQTLSDSIQALHFTQVDKIFARH